MYTGTSTRMYMFRVPMYTKHITNISKTHVAIIIIKIGYLTYSTCMYTHIRTYIRNSHSPSNNYVIIIQY